MIDYRLLTHDQLMQENFRLTQIIDDLKKEKEEFDKCTARVNPPNKNYKELESKLAQAEQLRQKDIDELWETRITPLQNEVKDKKIQLESAYKSSESQKDRIKALEMAVAVLKSKIDYAIGYISATPYMRDKHPDEVKRWLFKEFE
jgi:chromosome segregation ATPase